MGYQQAIEDVYWRHRIWPKERPDPKPSLDAVMSQAQLEKKVTEYLRNSQALEDYWHRPITAEQLQAEMDRMAQHTRQPEVLRELFEALGNDPFVIAECLARPALAERLNSDLSRNQTGPESLRTAELQMPRKDGDRIARSVSRRCHRGFTFIRRTPGSVELNRQGGSGEPPLPSSRNIESLGWLHR